MLFVFWLLSLLMRSKCVSLGRLHPRYATTIRYPMSSFNKKVIAQQIRMNNAGRSKGDDAYKTSRIPALDDFPESWTAFADRVLVDIPSKFMKLNAMLLSAQHESLDDYVDIHNQYADLSESVSDPIMDLSPVVCSVPITGHGTWVFELEPVKRGQPEWKLNHVRIVEHSDKWKMNYQFADNINTVELIFVDCYDGPRIMDENATDRVLIKVLEKDAFWISFDRKIKNVTSVSIEPDDKKI